MDKQTNEHIWVHFLYPVGGFWRFIYIYFMEAFLSSFWVLQMFCQDENIVSILLRNYSWNLKLVGWVLYP